MLANYNNDPWDIETDKITFQELYDLWLEKRAVKLGESNLSLIHIYGMAFSRGGMR